MIILTGSKGEGGDASLGYSGLGGEVGSYCNRNVAICQVVPSHTFDSPQIDFPKSLRVDAKLL